MALVGYARVSTQDQVLDLQRDALEVEGAERIFEESASGASRERPQLAAALDYVREGDTLVVWRLDRLGRSLSHLLSVVEGLTERGVHLRSLQESIDTSTATGRMVLGIFGALAEFERELIRERTRAGLDAARARGRKGGRPSVMTPAKARSARALIKAETPLSEVAASLGVSRATLYRWLEREHESDRSKVA